MLKKRIFSKNFKCLIKRPFIDHLKVDLADLSSIKTFIDSFTEKYK